jgi:hypothetical protein
VQRINGEHLPTEFGYNAKLQSCQDPGEDDKHHSMCRNPSVVQTQSFISCPGGWSQTIPQVKEPDVEVLGWRGYTWSAVTRPVGRTA